MGDRLSYAELKRIVDEFCLNRGRVLTSSASDSARVMEGMLYEAFVFRIHFAPDGHIEPSLHVGPTALIDSLFGEPLRAIAEREPVLASLARIDEYCRLQLPGKFLEAFARATEARRGGS